MRVKNFLPCAFGLTAFLLVAGGVWVWKRNLLPEESKNATAGEVFGASQEAAAADFPVDIPLFEPAAISSKNETKNGVQITLETNRPPESVEKFYREQLAEEGWEKLEKGRYEKKETGRLEITLAGQEGGKTVIVLTYSRLETK